MEEAVKLFVQMTEEEMMDTIDFIQSILDRKKNDEQNERRE